MNVSGITWHAVILEPAPFAATKQLVTDVLGIPAQVEMDSFVLFTMANGTMLELYTPQSVPPYGYNGDIAFGFRVDDIEAASAALAQAGHQLLGDITRLEDIGYAYRHFRGPDGQVYGLNEQKDQQY